MSHEKLESLNSRSQKQERGSSTLKNIHIFLSAVAISIVGSDFYVTNDFNMESTFVLLFSLFFFCNIIRLSFQKFRVYHPLRIIMNILTLGIVTVSLWSLCLIAFGFTMEGNDVSLIWILAFLNQIFLVPCIIYEMKKVN